MIFRVGRVRPASDCPHWGTLPERYAASSSLLPSKSPQRATRKETELSRSLPLPPFLASIQGTQPQPRGVGPPSRCALSQPPPALPLTSGTGACRQHQCRRHGAPERSRGVERRPRIGSWCRARRRRNGRGEKDAASPPPSARPPVLDDPQSRPAQGGAPSCRRACWSPPASTRAAAKAKQGSSPCLYLSRAGAQQPGELRPRLAGRRW
jgi:hypothetical protein